MDSVIDGGIECWIAVHTGRMDERKIRHCMVVGAEVN
jgi:hypothetical protein